MTSEKQTEAPIVNQDHELKIKDSAMNLWSYLGSLSSKLGYLGKCLHIGDSDVEQTK